MDDGYVRVSSLARATRLLAAPHPHRGHQTLHEVSDHIRDSERDPSRSRYTEKVNVTEPAQLQEDLRCHLLISGATCAPMLVSRQRR
jgi:hypothetical protein